MALSRRAVNRMSGNIWPGFVDAMTALLLVLMFVLTIFMIVQFMLRETITGQATELDALSDEMNALAQALGMEQQRSFQLEEQVSSLETSLGDAVAQAERQLALITTLNAQTEAQADDLAQKAAQITSFEAQVATLLSERDTARETIAELDAEQTRLMSEQEALQLALAATRDEVDAQAEAARLAAARREALDALIADLRVEAAEKDVTLAGALSRLQASEAEAANLADRLETAQTELSEEEATRLAEAAAAQALREKLKSADDELTAMTLALEQKRREAEDTLTLLAAARAAEDGLNERLAAVLTEQQRAAAAQAAAEADAAALRDTLGEDEDLRDRLAAALAAKLAAEQEASGALSEAEERAALLRAANTELAVEEARSAESLRKVALLNEQIAALRGQLGSLQSLLDEAEARDAAAEVRIQSLGTNLNTALARAAAEQKKRAELEEAERKRLEAEAKQLERYRSEFFGEMRAVLGDREGVQIVGDRFVFSSEVLFRSASADLSPQGKAQIASVAGILDEVSDKIPPEIDWVIRVDGHTDKTPLSGSGRYRDNWELSQARALAVVRYMTDDLGFASNRLAATGFAEFQPVADGDDPQSLAQNRRIELKLTER